MINFIRSNLYLDSISSKLKLQKKNVWFVVFKWNKICLWNTYASLIAEYKIFNPIILLKLKIEKKTNLIQTKNLKYGIICTLGWQSVVVVVICKQTK